MSYTARYDKGDWKADCDVCGRTYHASILQQRWDGLMCCPDDWEIRQPQDFVRGVPDTQITPWSRPEPNNQFIEINYEIYPEEYLTLTDSIQLTLIPPLTLTVADSVNLTESVTKTIF